MNIGIYSILFFILTPGILFRLSKNNIISGLSHGIIFSVIFYIFYNHLESIDESENIDMFLDASCNILFKESDSPSDDSPLYVIQNSNCINMEDWKESS